MFINIPENDGWVCEGMGAGVVELDGSGLN
jgi:hypothetical protein